MTSIINGPKSTITNSTNNISNNTITIIAIIVCNAIFVMLETIIIIPFVLTNSTNTNAIILGVGTIRWE